MRQLLMIYSPRFSASEGNYYYKIHGNGSCQNLLHIMAYLWYQAEVIRSWRAIFYRNILFIKLYLIIAIVVLIMFYAFCLNRYLSYVMDVPTPTTDCLNLVYDLLEPPVITRKNSNASLSCLEVSSTSLLFNRCNLDWLMLSIIIKKFQVISWGWLWD